MLEQSHKALSSSKHFSIIHWTMVFVTTILSLIPLFIVGPQQREGFPTGEFGYLSNSTSIDGTLSNAAFLSLTDDAVHLSKSYEYARVMGPFLGLALPVMMDVIVDIYVLVTQPSMRGNNVVRLSLLERAVFITGVFLNGLYLLFPLDWNPMLTFTIQGIFANINTLLTAAPIIIFLERTVDVISPLLLTFLITLLCSGIVCLNCSFLLVIDATSLTYRALFAYSEISLSICFGCIILACFWSLFCFLSTNRWLRQYCGWNLSSGASSTERDSYEEFSVNQVPALHMIALSIMCIINLYWFNTPTVIPIENESLLNLLLLLSTALVLTIEMRIRQNEVMHGLFLLDSKKSFVRFVSHEVRTPLSTAMMGLELLGIDLQPSTANDEVEEQSLHFSSAVASLPREDLEALQLVHESLSVAVAIFDNLAEYDAHGHENQKMELNIITMNAATLITKIVKLLQLQARRSNVQMQLNCFLDAMVDVDQRRMAQAIRALVSTAIALTPKAGAIIISVRLENSENYNDKRYSQRDLSSPASRSVANKNRIGFARRASMNRSRRGSNHLATSSEYVAINPPTFVVLEISYDGPGFDKADTKRVNKKMFSFDPRELHGGGGSGVGTGSGLGLALAKMIAEAHGGHLWVQSEGVDKGSVLSLGLPLSQSIIHKTHPPSSAASEIGGDTAAAVNYYNHLTEVSPPVTEQERGLVLSLPPPPDVGSDPTAAIIITEQDSEIVPPPPPPPKSEPSTSLHVLVVEDSAVARIMLVKMLKSLKFTTEEAEDGVEAVRMVQASIDRNNDSHRGDDDVENGTMIPRAFDCILCDSVMPNMAGPEAVKLIRAMGYTNPILGVTGNTLPEQVEDFIAHGVNDVLSKPVKLNVLKEELARHLKELNK